MVAAERARSRPAHMLQLPPPMSLARHSEHVWLQPSIICLGQDVVCMLPVNAFDFA
jgi:hypothetical protein